MSKFEFFSQKIIKIIMMTSLLAGKLAKVKNEITINIMNAIVNPSCNILLATFFELISKHVRKERHPA